MPTKFIELGIKGSIGMTSSMTFYRPNRVSIESAILIKQTDIRFLAAPSAPYGATKAAGK